MGVSLGGGGVGERPGIAIGVQFGVVPFPVQISHCGEREGGGGGDIGASEVDAEVVGGEGSVEAGVARVEDLQQELRRRHGAVRVRDCRRDGDGAVGRGRLGKVRIARHADTGAGARVARRAGAGGGVGGDAGRHDSHSAGGARHDGYFTGVTAGGHRGRDGGNRLVFVDGATDGGLAD